MSSHCQHRRDGLLNRRVSLDQGSYYGAVAGRFDGGVAILSQVVHESARLLPEHDHALAYFCMLVAGHYTETIAGLTLDYRPFDVGFHPARTPHRDTIRAGGARFLCLEIRGEALAKSDVRLGIVPALLPSVATLQLLRVHRHFTAQTMEPIVLEAAVWELCGGVSDQPEVVERRVPAWLGRCLELVEGEFSTAITIAEIAARVDIHPVHLSREFRRRFGQTVGEYVQKVRVRAACALMTGEPAALSAVAASVGFADQAHFCRVFKSLVGCTPSRFTAGLNSGPH